MPFIPPYEPLSGTHSPSVASPDAASAPGRGFANFGKGISNIANDLSQIQLDRQKETDFAIRAKAALAQEKARVDHLAWREENPDPAAWEADMTYRAAQIRDSLAGEKPSPAGQQALDNQLASWEITAIGDARIDGLKQARANDRSDVTRLGYAYRQSGKFEEARALLRDARDTGLFTPGEIQADEESLSFQETEQAKKDAALTWRLSIDDDPLRALEILDAVNADGTHLNEPDMEDATRVRLIRQAEIAVERRKEEEFSIMKQAITRGDVTSAEIQELPLYLSEGERATLQAWHGRHAPPTEQDLTQAWEEVEGIRSSFTEARGRTIDEIAYRKQFAAARQKVMSLVSRDHDGPLMETLQRYSPAKAYDAPPGATPARADLMKDLEMEVRLTLTAAEKQGVFGGETAEPKGSTARRKQTASPATLQASRKRRDTEAEIIDWLHRQPDPDVETVRTYADRQIARLRAEQSASHFSLPGVLPQKLSEEETEKRFRTHGE